MDGPFPAPLILQYADCTIKDSFKKQHDLEFMEILPGYFNGAGSFSIIKNIKKTSNKSSHFDQSQILTWDELTRAILQ